MSPEEQRIFKRLAWAAMNHLEWQKRPWEFVQEPKSLLFSATVEALEHLALNDTGCAYQLHNLRRTYEGIDMSHKSPPCTDQA